MLVRYYADYSMAIKITILKGNLQIAAWLVVLIPGGCWSLSLYSWRYLAAEIGDLPAVLLLSILALVKGPRTRNAVALVSTLWRDCERQTRQSLALKASLFDISRVPLSFQNVISLDLSMCNPWDHARLCSTAGRDLPSVMSRAFPKVKVLKVYIRDSVDTKSVVSVWPNLEAVSLVRWHKQSLQNPIPDDRDIGAEILPILTGCPNLQSLDLSNFFCFQEDVISALSLAPSGASKLKSLNLMISALSSDGFKSSEILGIARLCPSLEVFCCVIETEPLLEDCVKDDTLESLGRLCPRLQVLELSDKWVMSPSSRVFSEAKYPLLTSRGLISLVSNLPCLRELTLQLWKVMPHCGVLMEELAANCPLLAKLQVSSFFDIWHSGSIPLGLSGYLALREVTLKRCADLTDKGLMALSDSCRRLQRVDLWNCQEITAEGLAYMAKALKNTLRSVTVCQCSLITSQEAVRALARLRRSLESLQLDCDWRDLLGVVVPVDGTATVTVTVDVNAKRGASVNMNSSLSKRSELPLTSTGIAQTQEQKKAAEGPEEREATWKPWLCLKKLTLWAPPGLLLTPLQSIGLTECPALEEVRIIVEGECREIPLPSSPVFGLAVLTKLPKLTRVSVDLSEMIGFNLTCKPGFVDLPIWERFYLHGVQFLKHCEWLEYFPPSDAAFNRRSLSLPAAAILSECSAVRKLFIHGTANEHLLKMLLKCAQLRDLHVVFDFYPYPEDEILTKMRVAIRKRLETALANRGIQD